MDPINIIRGILCIASEVRDAYHEVRGNKKQCFTLQARVIACVEALEHVRPKIEAKCKLVSPDAQRFRTTLIAQLQAFRACCEDARDLVKQFAQTSVLSRFIGGIGRNSDFLAINARLSQAQADLGFGLQVKELFSAERDRNDVRDDLADIRGKQDEILAQICEERASAADRYQSQRNLQNEIRDMLRIFRQLQSEQVERKQECPADVLSIPLSDLSVDFTKPVAGGGYGDVYHGVWNDDEEVAVKKLRVASMTPKVKSKFFAELTFLARLPVHSHVLPLRGVCIEESNGTYLMVMAWMSNGSLFDYLHSTAAAALPLSERVRIATQCCKSLKHLHLLKPPKGPILHGDVKSPNFLLDRHLDVHVCDFGMAVVRSESAIQSMPAARPMAGGGSTLWLAPEMMSDDFGRRYDQACEIFSLGVVMWEIFTGEQPYEGISPSRIQALVQQGHRPPMTSRVPESVQRIIRAAWHQDPKKRPSCAELIQQLNAVTTTIESEVPGALTVITEPSAADIRVTVTPPPPAYPFLLRQFSIGAPFRKFDLAANGRVTASDVTCFTCGAGAGCWLHWVPSGAPLVPLASAGIPLADRPALLFGKQASLFRRAADELVVARADAESCFALVAGPYTLCLEAGSREQRSMWVDGLLSVLVDLGQTPPPSRPQPLKQTSPAPISKVTYVPAAPPISESQWRLQVPDPSVPKRPVSRPPVEVPSKVPLAPPMNKSPVQSGSFQKSPIGATNPPSEPTMRAPVPIRPSVSPTPTIASDFAQAVRFIPTTSDMMNLNGKKLQSADFISFTKLTSLSLADNRFESIASLTRLDALHQLVTLDLSSNLLRNLSGIGRLPKLRILKLQSNRFPSIQSIIEPLRECNALEHLFVHRACATDVTDSPVVFAPGIMMDLRGLRSCDGVASPDPAFFTDPLTLSARLLLAKVAEVGPNNLACVDLRCRELPIGLLHHVLSPLAYLRVTRLFADNNPWNTHPHYRSIVAFTLGPRFTHLDGKEITANIRDDLRQAMSQQLKPWKEYHSSIHRTVDAWLASGRTRVTDSPKSPPPPSQLPAALPAKSTPPAKSSPQVDNRRIVLRDWSKMFKSGSLSVRQGEMVHFICYARGAGDSTYALVRNGAGKEGLVSTKVLCMPK